MIKHLISIFFLASILVIYSCDSQPKLDFQFEEVDTGEEDWRWILEEEELPDSLKLFRGQTWKEWRKTFKDCMEAKWIKRPFYFGPSNTVNLGALTSKNYKQLRWTLKDVFTKEEMSKLINEGSPSSCSIKRKIELDLETTLEGELNEVGKANLKFAIDNAKSTTTTIDGFQVDNLIEAQLELLLNNPDTEEKKLYREDILEGKYVLLNRVIKVSGFTTEIELNNKISADLEGELADNPELEIGESKVKVKFSKKNDTTIEVKSLGDFVVFGKFVKSKKVDI